MTNNISFDRAMQERGTCGNSFGRRHGGIGQVPCQQNCISRHVNDIPGCFLQGREIGDISEGIPCDPVIPDLSSGHGDKHSTTRPFGRILSQGSCEESGGTQVAQENKSRFRELRASF